LPSGWKPEESKLSTHGGKPRSFFLLNALLSVVFLLLLLSFCGFQIRLLGLQNCGGATVYKTVE